MYLDGIAKTAPFTFDTLIGFTHTIEARDQTVGGNDYTFSAWSDGGAKSHTVTVPATAQSYTATYTATPAPTRPGSRVGVQRGLGRTATDTSGNDNTATLLNGLGRVAGKYGSGLSFDGSNDYLTAAQHLPQHLGQRADPVDVAQALGWQRDQVLLGKHWNTSMTSRTTSTAWSCSPGRQAGLHGRHDGRGVSATMGSTLPTTQWSHLAVAFNGTTVQFYVNGARRAQSPRNAITARTNPTHRRGRQHRPVLQGSAGRRPHLQPRPERGRHPSRHERGTLKPDPS